MDSPMPSERLGAWFVDTMQRASRLIADVEQTRRLEGLKVNGWVTDTSAGRATSAGATLARAEAGRRKLSAILVQLAGVLYEHGEKGA